MKEKDFYKEVMRRGFEPDFDKLSVQIQSAAEEPTEPARVKSKSFFAVAAAAAVGIGLAAALALNTLSQRMHTSPLSSSPENAAESSTQSALQDQPEKLLRTEERGYLYYNGEMIYDDDLNKLSEDQKNMNDQLIDEIDDSFYDNVRFLGLSVEPSDESGAAHKRLETNRFPAGTPVFRDRKRNTYYFWVQSSPVSVDIISFGDNEEDYYAMPLGKYYWLDDINKYVHLIGARVLEKEPESHRFELGIDRSTLNDPNDERIGRYIWDFTFETDPSEQVDIPDSKYVIRSEEELKVGMYVWVAVCDSSEFDEDHLFKQGFLYHFDDSKDTVEEKDE